MGKGHTPTGGTLTPYSNRPGSGYLGAQKCGNDCLHTPVQVKTPMQVKTIFVSVRAYMQETFDSFNLK